MSHAAKDCSINSDKFSQDIIDRVMIILGIKSSDQIPNFEGSLISAQEEIPRRLNLIKALFANPDSFNTWVAPSEMRKMFKKQHKKIADALDVLRSLNGPIIESSENFKKPNLAKIWLYEASEVDSAISAGLVGHDVALFDKDFYLAFESLKKVEGYFSSVLDRADNAVRGRGDNKRPNTYSDYLLISLCEFYRNVTGHAPIAYLAKGDEFGQVKGKIIEFLDYILRHFLYPNEITHWALEKRLRDLKLIKSTPSLG